MSRLALLTILSLILGLSTQVLFAETMVSPTYRIQADSLNIGGTQSSSTSYSLEDTVGEIGTGFGSSTTYNLYAGYQQMHEVYLAITSPADVTLSPSIGGVTGGTSNGSTNVTVTTDGFAGYQLMLKASTSPALVSGANSFADYTPSGANPDFTFSIAAIASEFGFSPEGTDVATRYKDNGSACGTGSGDTVDACWDALSTTNRVIAEKTSANHPSGTQTTIKFRAESGSSHLQSEGTYTGTTTITALPL